MPKVKVDNLEAEMKRNKISRSDIAKLLGLSYRTIHSRFNGESEKRLWITACKWIFLIKGYLTGGGS